MSKNKLKILTFFVLVIFIAPAILAQFNYRQNVKAAANFINYTQEGYIQDQNATESFNYGLNTSDNTGCGWIATYNVLTYLDNKGLYNKQIDIENIIRQLDSYGTLGYSYLGTNPLAIKLFLRLQGLKSKLVLNKEEYVENTQTSDINIMVYVSKKFNYAHYQMMEYNENTNDYTFYTPNSTKTMSEFLQQRKDDYTFMLAINA
jgi:hypothetical protein